MTPRCIAILQGRGRRKGEGEQSFRDGVVVVYQRSGTTSRHSLRCAVLLRSAPKKRRGHHYFLSGQQQAARKATTAKRNEKQSKHDKMLHNMTSSLK